ncbi:hypothetical protein HDU82_007647 [Entophlyctis luteolus]|nr:hypothetical protein HDU82_007647 [Entophlyctis luteolus]
MHAIATALVATLAAFVRADCSVPPGSTCETSGGSWLVITSPYANSSYQSGGSLSVIWDVCGNDATFKASTITLDVADATDSTNVQVVSGGTLSSAAEVSSGQLATTMPTAVPSGNKFTVRSSYHDATANKWIYCFGNTFAVTGGSSAAAATAANTASTKTATASGSSGKQSAMAGAAAALLAGLAAEMPTTADEEEAQLLGEHRQPHDPENADESEAVLVSWGERASALLLSARDWCRSHQAVVAVAAAAAGLALLLGWLDCVYLPSRLQGGALAPDNGNKRLEIKDVRICDISGAAIVFNLSATQHLSDSDKPPTTLRLSPARFSFVNVGNTGLPVPRAWRLFPAIPSSWTGDLVDSESPSGAFGFDFPGLSIPPKLDKVDFAVSSQVDAFDIAWQVTLDSKITGLVNYAVSKFNFEEQSKSGIIGSTPIPPTPFTLRQQSIPTYWFPAFSLWKWNIPMWQYIRVDVAPPSVPPTEDESLFYNVTIHSQDIAIVPVIIPSSPEPVLTYRISTLLSLASANPVTVPAQAGIAFSLSCVLSHNGIQMVTVIVSLPRGIVARTWNEGAVAIDAQSIAANGGTDEMMRWFGAYAAGEDTLIHVSDIRVIYAVKVGDGVGRLGWIEEMIARWSFDLYVRGAQEENDVNAVFSPVRKLFGQVTETALGRIVLQEIADV